MLLASRAGSAAGEGSVAAPPWTIWNHPKMILLLEQKWVLLRCGKRGRPSLFDPTFLEGCALRHFHGTSIYTRQASVKSRQQALARKKARTTSHRTCAPRTLSRLSERPSLEDFYEDFYAKLLLIALTKEYGEAHLICKCSNTLLKGHP